MVPLSKFKLNLKNLKKVDKLMFISIILITMFGIVNIIFIFYIINRLFYNQGIYTNILLDINSIISFSFNNWS